MFLLVGGDAVRMSAVDRTAASESQQECSAYSSIPLPAEAATNFMSETYPTCASYRSYRGIGRRFNLVEARECAWNERLAQKAKLRQNEKEPTAWVVGGSLILADIYFNGAGVKRNIPLALHLACEADEGTASLALQSMAKPNDSHRPIEPFEFCDYAATTFMMNFCAGYEQEIGDDRRSRYYNSLVSAMTLVQKAAFRKLLAAQKGYVEAHASEVYQGGSIRAVRTMGSQRILDDLFHTELLHFEHGRWPVLSSNQIAVADSLLNREYKQKLLQLHAPLQEDIFDGAVTANQLSGVEDSWEIYREAWVAFATVRYPAAVAVIRAEITLDRYRLLKTIS
jgi:uncharacterized protein YecT (DUF1311 family)